MITTFNLFILLLTCVKLIKKLTSFLVTWYISFSAYGKKPAIDINVNNWQALEKSENSILFSYKLS